MSNGKVRERSLSIGSDDDRAGVHSRANGATRHDEPKAASAAAARRQENGGASVGGARPRPLDAAEVTLWQRYIQANKTNPLKTKCLTTGPVPACDR